MVWTGWKGVLSPTRHTPEATIRTPHNGIVPPLPALEEGTNHIVVTWTFPADSTPSLVSVQPFDLTRPDFGRSFPLGTNELVMEMSLNVALGSSPRVTGTILVNGQQLLDLATFTGPVISAGSDSANLLLYPVLNHPASGTYHVTVQGGQFDVFGDWRPSHAEHRIGQSADVGTNTTVLGQPDSKFVLLARKYGLDPHDETSTGSPHYHLRFVAPVLPPDP